MPKLFNEDTLREAIVEIWGEYGAHVEVFDHILKLARKHGELLECLRLAHCAALQAGYQPGDEKDRDRVRNALGAKSLIGE